VLTLEYGLDFDPAREQEFFAALPPHPAVCLIESKQDSAEPLFIRTQDLRRRLQRLLGPPDPSSKRLNLRDFAKSVRYRLTASPFEQTFAYYQNAKELFPTRYRDMLRMRPPAVLKVNLRNAYPRCYPTRRIPIDSNGDPSGGIYFGPFPSRKAADTFAERVLDLFKVRRCQIKIRRDPEFPGCIYSEMKMCLAPCFAGCTKEEYDSEVRRLVNFLETGGSSLREAMEADRNKASEDLDYEKAALLHKKLDKLDDALRGQPELPRRLQDLNAVILQRAVTDQSISAYEVRSGRIAEPFELSFAQLSGEPRSAEQLLREHLEPAITNIPDSVETVNRSEAMNLSGTSGHTPAAELSEHLWLLARWFYSNPRHGEIFFRTNGWPYRRMMRACARLLAPPDAAAGSNQASASHHPDGERNTS
jgi:excinuclease UvrABC nuclease subunit